MLRVWCGFLVCLTAGAQQTPSFRAGTSLIEFTVVATDAQGRPVSDLKKEEIRISDQGQRRETAFFRFEGGAGTRRLETPPAGVVSNRAEYRSGPARHITAILLDALNTPPGDQAAARDQVIEYLRAIEADTRIAVFRLAQDLTVLHDFTSDAASLRARLETDLRKVPVFNGNPDVADLDCILFGHASSSACTPGRPLGAAETMFYQMAARRRVDATLAALETLGDHLVGIAGRKSLVWIGAGIPMQSFTGDRLSGGLNSGFQSYETQVRRTAQKLASQGVAVYPVDAKGAMRAAAPLRRRSQAEGNVLSNYRPEAASQAMADTTGGRVVKWTNDLTQGLKLAAADRSATYSLGFYSGKEPDNQWHRLAVKVLRPGVTISYRQGYVASAEKPHDWSDGEWRSAIANPLLSTAIRLDAHLEPVVGGEPGTYLLLLQIASEDLYFQASEGAAVAEVEIGIAERTPVGTVAFHAKRARIRPPKQAGNGALYSERWKLKAETASLRLVVRDQVTGRYGTLDVDK